MGKMIDQKEFNMIFFKVSGLLVQTFCIEKDSYMDAI